MIIDDNSAVLTNEFGKLIFDNKEEAQDYLDTQFTEEEIDNSGLLIIVI